MGALLPVDWLVNGWSITQAPSLLVEVLGMSGLIVDSTD